MLDSITVSRDQWPIDDIKKFLGRNSVSQTCWSSELDEDKVFPTLNEEKTPTDGVVDVFILVTPHGNVSDELSEYAIFRTKTTGLLDKFVGIEENQHSLQNMNAFKKVFGSFESKLSLKRKQNAQSDQFEAKKVKTSVR